MTTDPAVTAAAEALSIIGGVPDIWDLRAAGIAVAAARPIIEAEERERILNREQIDATSQGRRPRGEGRVMTDLDLDAIEARANAATDGPWFWRNTQGRSGDVYLQGARTRIVMAFKRMGMNGAQPMFRGLDGLLYESADVNINQFPDAEFIAYARTDVPALVAALREARADCETHHTTVVHQCCEDAQAVPSLRAALATVTAERDEARADAEAAKAALAASEQWDMRVERDDWRRRYEALRDGVTGLTEDEWGSRADETERCPLCRRKWSKHTDYDGRCYDGASTLAGYIRDLRAVVARVEGDES